LFTQSFSLKLSRRHVSPREPVIHFDRVLAVFAAALVGLASCT